MEITPADVQCAIRLRAGLRQFFTDGEANRGTVATLNWVAARAPLRPRVGRRRADVWMEPAVDGFDGALGRLLLLYQLSQAKGPCIRKRQPSVSDRWLTR